MYSGFKKNLEEILSFQDLLDYNETLTHSPVKHILEVRNEILEVRNGFRGNSNSLSTL
jgi:hypothetical protein